MNTHQTNVRDERKQGRRADANPFTLTGAITSVRCIGAFTFDRLSRSRNDVAASSLLVGGYCTQIVFQMSYFLILTRMLGPELFGRFAAALAVISIVSPLAGAGFGEVALVRVSQDSTSAGFWMKNAVIITSLLGAVVSIGLALIASLFASDQWLEWPLMLGLAISELVLVRSCCVLGRITLARGEVGWTSLINVVLAGSKALVAGGLLIAGNTSLAALVILLNIGLVPVVCFFTSSLRRRVQIGKIAFRDAWKETTLAASFATSLFCKTIYTDLDKLFLANWSTSYVVGTYTAGYKILILSFMPIRAILEATVSRQLHLAVTDAKACLFFTAKMFGVNVSIAAALGLVLFATAPWATVLLGKEFEESIGILRIGFLLPAIQAAHCTLGNYLTAVGCQSHRTYIQMFVLVVYIVASAITIPRYSWQGALWTTLACETGLAIMFAINCGRFVRDNIVFSER